MEKKLAAVLQQLPQAVVTGTVENQVITDLTIDSRTAGPGGLFICLKGVHTNGHAYIGKAAAQGAAAILVEEDVPTVPGVVLIRVKDTTAAMTALAPWFYDYRRCSRLRPPHPPSCGRNPPAAGHNAHQPGRADPRSVWQLSKVFFSRFT